MQAIVELPEDGLREVETLACQEGATTSDLFRRIVESYLNRIQSQREHRQEVRLPLIPASETGPIQLITGPEVDEPLSREHLPA